MKHVNIIHLSLTDDEVADLQAAAAGTGCNDLSLFLAQLVHHISDGVRRPGSWERGWLQKVSWNVASFVEPDPVADWRQVPTAAARSVVWDGVARRTIASRES